MTSTPDSAWLRIIRGDARRPSERLAGAGLWALSIGYGVALHLHLAGYHLGIARRSVLPVTVVSVGNLTVGGTGKTTASLAIARWLLSQGKRVALLSRGYRGRGERQAAVVSGGSGPLLDVEAAGDEAYLAAQKLPDLRVLAGKDRRVTGKLAVEQLGVDAIVLDDGFQYQRLQRDLDIVLVDALAPFGYDFLVPRGLLREPPEHIARADAVWLTHSDLVKEEELGRIRARVTSFAPKARIWETIHAPVRLRRLDGKEEVEPDALRGRPVCALSSLGNPRSFEQTLARLGAELVTAVRFPDHHRYRGEELYQVAQGQAAEAEWIVTTEKDAVRMPTQELGKPIWILEVELAGCTESTGLAEEMRCLLRAKNKI